MNESSVVSEDVHFATQTPDGLCYILGNKFPTDDTHISSVENQWFSRMQLHLDAME